jgi:hypothetical protein
MHVFLIAIVEGVDLFTSETDIGCVALVEDNELVAVVEYR